MKKFVGADREQSMLMPYDLMDWLPESHLARFIVDIVDKLDFSQGIKTSITSLIPSPRIMKTSGGFDQCFNAQAAVNDDMLIVGAYSNSHVNDKQEFIPAIEAVPEELTGELSTAVADTGYFSENNMTGCEEKKITPLISTSRESHNSFLSHILTDQAQMEEPEESAAEKMNRQLKSEEGKKIYKKRKQTVEPVSGIIKEILGFRRFSLRGEAETDAEWSLVCPAYNLKRLFSLKMA